MTTLDLLAIAAILLVMFVLASLGERCINYLFPPPRAIDRRRHGHQPPADHPRRRASDLHTDPPDHDNPGARA